MRPSPAQWFAAVLLLFAGPALAEPLGYASGFRDLYRVDLANGQATLVGRMGFSDVEGLAMSPQGVLFGAADATMTIGGNSSATTDFLFRVDSASGGTTLVGQFPGLQGRGPNEQLDYGLAFTCDGRLWMSAETTGELWEVNPGTAALRLVGSMGASISGLAGRGNELYGVSVDPNPRLYQIDTDTAAAVALGPLGVSFPVANVGLDFDASGSLWATLDPFSSASRMARLSLQTGAATEVRILTAEQGVPIKALAIAPPPACPAGPAPQATPIVVPGPAAPVLLGLASLAGLLGGLKLRRRRR